MDIFFLSLKKLLVTTIFAIFAFVMVYVPQAPTNHVPNVQAAASGSIINDPINTAQNALTTAQATISAALTNSSWTKELSLDNIAWSLAKNAITVMTTQFLDWVSGGFDGSPKFVTDVRGFLTSVADQTFDSVITELGGAASFICAPFRLDVQIAVAQEYDRSRTGINGDFGGTSAPTCTLSGVIDNIQGFIDGTDPGRGLADWLTITSAPQTYTPYGAELTAKDAVRARLINAEGEEIQLLNFGSGFLSQEVCEPIEGTTRENCTVTTPGTTIANQLNKALGAGQDVLIEADEINEIIGSLLGRLANQAITGAAGLLGLSDDTGQSYGGYDGSFLDAVTQEGGGVIGDSVGSAIETLSDALRVERVYRSDSQFLLDQLATFIVDASNSAGSRNVAAVLNEEIANEVFVANANIESLTAYLTEFETATVDRQVDIFIEFSNLDITDNARKEQNLNEWREQMSLIGIDPRDTRGVNAILDSFSSTTTSSTTGSN